MNQERFIFGLAGGVLLTSLALAQIFSPLWLWLTAMVGINLLVLSFTGFCPAITILKKLGVRFN